MINKHAYRKSSAFLLALWMLAGCGGTPATGTTVWIDAPLPGAQIEQGEIIQVQTHAYDSFGVAEIELAVNGEPYRRDAPSPAGGDLVTLSQDWSSNTPGIYTLRVSAISTNGAVSSPAAVSVEVLGAQPADAIPEEATPPEAPTDTPATPSQPPEIIFNADQLSLTAGECTTLRWEIRLADAAYLDGTGVAMQDARQVCPTQTTAYTLRASSGGEENSRIVQISVTAAPAADATGPVISAVTANPALIYDSSACGANQTRIKATVTDAGSGVKRVDLYFQASASGQTGLLQSLKMEGDESQGFKITLSPAQLSGSLTLYGGGNIRYYLVATDQAGNTTQSKTFTVQTEICLT